MTKRGKQILLAVILGLAARAHLAADTLPSGDTLSITLFPLDGAVDGVLGATVGWGFTVDWTSSNGDWISFTGSSIGSIAPGGNETNSGVLATYTDFIGAQGGPDDFAIGPTDSPWTETFDGSSMGIGSYQITSDPSYIGAEDTGQITIDYDVTNEDPTLAGAVDLGSGSYYGTSTAFSVTVDDNSASPEPASLTLVTPGVFAFVWMAWSKRRRKPGAYGRGSGVSGGSPLDGAARL